MLKIIVTTIIITSLALSDGIVLQTGQTMSYDTNGNVVTDGSVKDDGYYQIGISRNYSRNGGIVIDNSTGLEWEDNETIQKPWVTQENYDDGNYSDTSGDTAATYCNNFSLGGHMDWRLPSVEELHTLVDYQKINPSLTESIFQNYASDVYWSSTTDSENNYNSWSIRFDYGYLYYGNTKDNTYYVRCVRGGEIEPSNLSRNNDIVSDSTSGLQWQDDAAAKTTFVSWQNAIDYCENMSLNSLSDWRLPTQPLCTEST